MSLQASFSGPLYQQVHESLKSKITNGEWKGGMVIPGDAELSRQLGVSIGTVRKALDELARQRLVVRERGRGTFIKDPSAWSGDLETWLCDDAGRPLGAEISVVTAQTAVATPAEQRQFHMAVHRATPPRVHKLLRVWRHRGAIVCAERVLIDATRLPALLEEADLSNPVLTGDYLQKFRRGIGRTVWSIRTGQPDPALLEQYAQQSSNGAAPVPGIDRGLISCRRILHDTSDDPLEVSEQLVALGENVCRINC